MKYTMLFLMLLAVSVNVTAQTTAFTYQGQLQSSSVPGNGNFDFEFALFDAVGGGAQIGSTLTRSSVAVANGIFSVSLDFGSGFPGAGRFLEIRVRQTGGGGFTTLAPRQPVTSSPYAIKSIQSDSATVATNAITANNATTANNALQLGGVAANQFVVTTDSRMTNARPPTAGSANYIQNTTTPQTASDFNVTGNGTAGGTLSGNIVNAATRYNINGLGILSNAGFRNLFAGVSAGIWNTGNSNTFVGAAAGFNSMTGDGNTIVGAYNSFFGEITGNNNSFFGKGDDPSGGVTGSNNTTIGAGASVGSNVNFATALGAGAGASTSNTVVLGRASDTVRVPGSFASVGQVSTNGNLVVLGTSALVGIVDLSTLGAAGSQAICRNASGQISTCSSSLRYKTNLNRYGFGLNLINQLKPITFDWKEGGMHDLGLGAEDVAAIEPLLVTYNKSGEVEGVKYDRIGVVLVNAIKEQQKQIEELKAIVCELKPTASVCRK